MKPRLEIAEIEHDGLRAWVLAELPARCERLERAALTDAERAVLELAIRGLSSQEIAAARKRSVRTIANQLASIYRKTGTANRNDLAAWVTAPR